MDCDGGAVTTLSTYTIAHDVSFGRGLGKQPRKVDYSQLSHGLSPAVGSQDRHAKDAVR